MDIKTDQTSWKKIVITVSGMLFLTCFGIGYYLYSNLGEPRTGRLAKQYVETIANGDTHIAKNMFANCPGNTHVVDDHIALFGYSQFKIEDMEVELGIGATDNVDRADIKLSFSKYGEDEWYSVNLLIITDQTGQPQRTLCTVSVFPPLSPNPL